MQSDEGQHKYIRHKELCVNGWIVYVLNLWCYYLHRLHSVSVVTFIFIDIKNRYIYELFLQKQEMSQTGPHLDNVTTHKRSISLQVQFNGTFAYKQIWTATIHLKRYFVISNHEWNELVK